MWCPGCDDLHEIRIGEWSWDGSLEAPAVSPSILVTMEVPSLPALARRCHSFLRAGVWEFLSDSTHALAGQSVPMVPMPDWLTREARTEGEPS